MTYVLHTFSKIWSVMCESEHLLEIICYIVGKFCESMFLNQECSRVNVDLMVSQVQ
jgi:hypothetical protein